jgi:hypothetical protein
VGKIRNFEWGHLMKTQAEQIIEEYQSTQESYDPKDNPITNKKVKKEGYYLVDSDGSVGDGPYNDFMRAEDALDNAISEYAEVIEGDTGDEWYILADGEEVAGPYSSEDDAINELPDFGPDLEVSYLVPK